MKASDSKTEQLQIRVSRHEKALIKQAAKRAELPMSDWVLRKLLPNNQVRFQTLVKELVAEAGPRYTLAALNELLTELSSSEIRTAVAEKPLTMPNEYLSNYLVAMIEYACHKKGIAPPKWVMEINPLDKPVFATTLNSLRLHLLLNSPAPFRRRNIFIDASIGDQI